MQQNYNKNYVLARATLIFLLTTSSIETQAAINGPNSLKKLINDGLNFVNDGIELFNDISTVVTSFISDPIGAFFSLFSVNDGVAAGENINSSQKFKPGHALLMRGTVMQAQQKEYGDIPRSSLHKNAIRVGGKIQVDDVSIAATIGSSESWGRGEDVLNKTKMYNGYIVVLYTMENNFFIHSHVNYGASKIKTTRQILPNLVIHGKTSGDLFGVGAAVGYKYALTHDENINLMPSVSILYDQNSVKAYKQSNNTDDLTLNIGKTNNNSTAALFSTSVNYHLSNQSFTLSPEIHIRVRHNINQKAKKMLVSIYDIGATITPPSPAKTTYIIGVSTGFTHSKAYNMSIGYDLSVAKKYRAHAGYIKLKLNL